MQQQDQQGKQQQPQQKSTAVPPQQTNVNKWAEQGQNQAGAIQQQPVAQPSHQTEVPESFAQPAPSNQPKEAQDDRSKSFGESQQGQDSFQSPGETGIIPKENSFPEELPVEDQKQPESYKH